jgi:hypothetical protein
MDSFKVMAHSVLFKIKATATLGQFDGFGTLSVDENQQTITGDWNAGVLTTSD